jgi:cell division inhibitor SepF
MSALRKAGVWLGLVEEDDDRRDEGVFDDEFAEDDDDFAPAARPRSLARPASRVADRRLGRDTGRDARDTRDSGRESLRDSAREVAGRDSRDGRDTRVTDHHLADREVFRSDPRPSQRSAEPTSRARSETEAPGRYDRGDDDRASVRQLTRPSGSSTSSTSSPSSEKSFPTHDNLALAPQVQLRERAVVSEDKSRRYQITTLHPTSYSEARTIGEHFRDGYPVIMNLTEMDEADAKRLVDFAAGLAFGVRGSMERVTNRVFLLSPPNIQVSAEDKARIAEGGFLDHS